MYLLSSFWYVDRDGSKDTLSPILSFNRKLLLRVHLIVGETCQFFHACQNLTVRKEEGIVFRLHRWEGTGEMTQCYSKYFVCLSRWLFPFVESIMTTGCMNLDEISSD